MEPGLRNLRRRNADLGHGVRIGRGVVLGAIPERASRDTSWRARKTIVGVNAQIFNYVVIGAGSEIGARAVVEDRSRVGYDCSIGLDARVMYGAYICDRVNIGARARVAGFVCDQAKIEDGATSMGMLVHRYADPTSDWWGPDEDAPTIAAGAVIGMGAIVVGGVHVGERSYIGAGSVVTKDVPPDSVVVGNNQVVSRSAWGGKELA